MKEIKGLIRDIANTILPIYVKNSQALKIIIIPTKESVRAMVFKTGRKEYTLEINKKIFSEMDYQERIEVICHEMWHIIQYANHSLIDLPFLYAYFSGRIHKWYENDVNRAKYLNSPWEREARAYELILKNTYADYLILYNKCIDSGKEIVT